MFIWYLGDYKQEVWNTIWANERNLAPMQDESENKRKNRVYEKNHHKRTLKKTPETQQHQASANPSP